MIDTPADSSTAVPRPAAPSGRDEDGGIKAVLHWYLKSGRRDFRWKLEVLTERQLRMPMTPTARTCSGCSSTCPRWSWAT